MIDERKSRLHIHLGGLIFFIIILLILFKVDIKSKIQSPQFRENIVFVEEQAKNIWQTYVANPLKSKIGKFFIEITNKEIEKIQDGIVGGLLKNTNTENTP